MASVKLIFKENKVDNNGEIPLYIRIIKDRKTKFISIGVKLKPELWDDKEQVVKKKHPNSARMNAFIAQKVADAKEVALRLETTKGYVTSKGIKANILGKPAISFTQYFKDYLAILKTKGKIGTHDKANATYLKFEKYTNDKEIMFDEIDVNFLRNYEEYLKTTLKNKNNTIHSNLKVFRKLFNDAIREDIIELKLNPFTKFKLSWENTNKEYLTDEELSAVEEYSLKEGTMMYHHRNAYIFASYAAGIRISDLLQLKWKDFDGTHIQFKTQKTDDTIRVKLPSKALNIIHYYKSLHEKTNSEHYIFPFLHNDKDYSDPEIHFKAISSNTAYINKNLKTIKKDLELKKKLNFHTSRHTWATSALRKGMRIEYVSKLMTHSNIKTTQIYAKIVNSELDKAMDVFG
jgi:integrase/recombinase XerD